jgi:hypothetical protein
MEVKDVDGFTKFDYKMQALKSEIEAFRKPEFKNRLNECKADLIKRYGQFGFEIIEMSVN